MSQRYNTLTGTFDEAEDQQTLTRPCGCRRRQWFTDGHPAAGAFATTAEHHTCRKHGRHLVADETIAKEQGR